MNDIGLLKETLPPIIELIPNLRKKTSTELAGPCPFCGGDDRFVIFTDTGRFLCRHCTPRGGDLVDFHCKTEGLDIKGLASKYLQKEIKQIGKRVHIYTDSKGDTLYRKWVFSYSDGSKSASFERFEDGQYHKGLDGMEQVLYNLPVLKSSDPVLISESEKDADNLTMTELTAVSFGGANNWKAEFAKPLAGRECIILEHNEESGPKASQTVAASLHGAGCTVRVIKGATWGPHKGADVSDWLNAGHNKEELIALIEATPEWKVNPETQEAWSEPILFGELETPDIVPDKVFPDGWLKDFVTDVIRSTQTPSGMAVMFGLSSIAACIQRRFEVSPYGDDYTEPVNIWALSALDSANRKTAVRNAFTAPLSTFEREEYEKLQPDIRRTNNEREINLKRIEQLKGIASKPYIKEGSASRQITNEEIKSYLDEIASIENTMPEEIIPPRVWIDDATPERLQMLLAENRERVAVISDEGGIFEIMAGLYSDGRVNLNVFLQAHAGAPVRVERQGRQVDLERPALTFGIAVQPEVLVDFSKGNKRKFRGLGALARFLYCIPKSTVGSRDIKKRTAISETTKFRYYSGIMNLLSIKPVIVNGKETPQILTLSPESLNSWEAFCQYIESRIGVNGDLYSIQDWAGKLPGAALRIAGILHLVDKVDIVGRSIEKETLERALDLCELLIVHAKSAFDLMGTEESVTDAKYVLKWILDNKIETFSQRDCHKKFEGRFKRIDRLRKALEVLTERHIISEPQKRITGKRPGIEFNVNPQLFEGAIE